jgi:hypothetical protein
MDNLAALCFLGRRIQAPLPITPRILSRLIFVQVTHIITAALTKGALVNLDQEIGLELVHEILDQLQESHVDEYLFQWSTEWQQLVERRKDQHRKLASIRLRLESNSYDTVYGVSMLNKGDIDLALKWAQPEKLVAPSNIERLVAAAERGQLNEDHELARVLSARSAELAAMHFFRQFGCTVEDVSVQQCHNVNDEWALYDLLIDGKPFDVKNARRSRFSERHYVRHCVPKFKADRHNQEVSIVGVLSPYLWCESYFAPSRIPKRWNSTTHILGVTSQKVMEVLHCYFDIPGSFDCACSLNDKGITFLPRWIFDFPPLFYRDRDAALADYCAFVQEIDSDLWRHYSAELLVPSLAAGLKLPETAFGLRLEPWARRFCHMIFAWRQSYSLSLPFVYLTVLSHFVETWRQDVTAETYRPSQYRELLFPLAQDGKRCLNLPLYVFDQLYTVDELIETLDKLWLCREESVLKDIEAFRLRRLNILEGRTKGSSHWQTLIAYCGRCGYHPLVYGKHDSCCACMKLICPQVNCRFCSGECSGYSIGIDTYALRS